MNWSISLTSIVLVIILNTHSDMKQGLKLLEIKNTELKEIVSSFIQHEKKCTYYDSDLLIIIQFETLDSLELIQIESTNKIGLFGNELGGGKFLSHDFIVRGRKLESLFKIVKGKSFNSHALMDVKSSNQVEDSTSVDEIEDDSFTIWICDYSDGLRVLDKQTYCSDDDK